MHLQHLASLTLQGLQIISCSSPGVLLCLGTATVSDNHNRCLPIIFVSLPINAKALFLAK